MDVMNEQSGPTPGDTTTDPTANGPRVSREEMRDVNRLRRSTSDRYIAGVAGGLGRHFDVDPTIVRVLLAVLTFFGGAGVLVYGAVWLFVPEDGQDRAPVDMNAEARRIVLVVVGAIALMIVFGSPFFGDAWGWGFPLPLLIIALVLVAVFATRDNRRGAGTRNQPPPPWGTPPAGPSRPAQEGTVMTVTDTPPGTPPGGYAGPGYGPTGPDAAGPPPAWMPPPGPPYVPPPRPRRTGLVLFWPTLALIAIGLGLLGIFDVNGSVNPSAYVALALTITAAMLLVGAFVGRPGGLIALGILGSLGLGVASGVEASTDWETSGESRTVAPLRAAAVDDVYTVPNGEISLDLTGVRDLEALDGREIAVRLNAGEITVTLPRGLNAEVDADLSFAGDINIDGANQGGFDPSLNHTVNGTADPQAPTISLDLDGRVGQITVVQD